MNQITSNVKCESQKLIDLETQKHDFRKELIRHQLIIIDEQLLDTFREPDIDETSIRCVRAKTIILARQRSAVVRIVWEEKNIDRIPCNIDVTQSKIGLLKVNNNWYSFNLAFDDFSNVSRVDNDGNDIDKLGIDDNIFENHFDTCRLHNGIEQLGRSNAIIVGIQVLSNVTTFLKVLYSHTSSSSSSSSPLIDNLKNLFYCLYHKDATNSRELVILKCIRYLHHILDIHVDDMYDPAEVSFKYYPFISSCTSIYSIFYYSKKYSLLVDCWKNAVTVLKMFSI